MKGYNRIRKYISLSVGLVFLAILGFVLLQISWVSNLFETQCHRIVYDVQRSFADVAQDLASQQASSVPFLTPQRPKPGLKLPDNFFSTPVPMRVSDHYTFREIDQRVRAAMGHHDVKDLKVEYAVFYRNSAIEMMTPGYIMTIQDTLLPSFPIYLTSSSDFQSIGTSESFSVVIPNFKTQVWRSLYWSLAASILFTLIMFLAFYFTLRTMFEQRRLNKVKTDFINNMTHELKTPLATISLAVDALHNPKVQSDREKSNYFSNIIKDEYKRMNKHVETILQAGLMEKQELNIDLEPLHVHDIIEAVADNFTLQLEDKNGFIELHLTAEKDLIQGDETHFTNLINNLIDNAVKYAKENIPPQIIITTANDAKNIIISVADNGIGMNKDTVKHIFEKFFRAHTGNVHNVKGFGLGMSYVKSVVSLHKGKIKVDSELEKGSTFTVEIPLLQS